MASGIARAEPVLIGGINRSGTTLMCRLLGSHSEIAIPPSELCFFRDDLDPRAPIGDRAEFERRLRAMLARGKVREWELDSEQVLSAASAAELSSRGLFTLLLDQYRRQVGKPRMGEKTVLYELRLDVLDSWFPDHRFVHLIRNPIDIWASMNYPAGRPSSRPRLPDDLLLWAQTWNASVAIGLHRCLRDPGRYALVRYEDLVGDPRGTLERVCSVVDADFEPDRMLAMVDYRDKENSSFDTLADRRDYDGFIRRSDDVDRHGLVPKRERDQIVALCGELAYLSGYELEGAGPVRIRTPFLVRARFLGRRAAARARRAVHRRRHPS